jgi:hypothetical protein
VPRRTAFTGPIFEGMYGVALDPGSIDPKIEDDVREGSTPPRPVRLNEVVQRIHRPGPTRPDGTVSFPLREQASLVRGSVVTWPTIVYPDVRGYQYTENAEWWKQLCLGFPCFILLAWPDYGTKIEEVVIDGQQLVIQLWKGWCQKFLGMTPMPGGIGAEVGVYRRIPGLVRPTSSPPQLGTLGRKIVDGIGSLADNQLWWPFPELNATIDFTLRHPDTNQVFFSGTPQQTWWYCKWMNTDSYALYKTRNATPTFSVQYVLEYTIKGKSSSYTGTW